MHRLRRLAMILALTAAALPAAAADRAGPTDRAAEPRAGRFDYYVLSLSWSPSWCAGQGRAAAGQPQCDPRRRTGFVIHGLWPQNEQGWPADCDTDERDPLRRESQAMADVMGSGGLAWHQWQKHGRCSGLSAAGYYRAVRAAGNSVAIPPVLRMLPRDVRLPAGAIEDAFIDVNPGMTRDGVTVSCSDGRLAEVRICLTRDLQPRACAPDSRRDCSGPMLIGKPGAAGAGAGAPAR